MERLIFHVDVNSAYLSWEAARRVANGEEDIRLIPSAVGGDREKRTGVILAKSIPAKKYQVRTGEPVAIALRKCPQLYLVKPDFRLYEQNSRAFMDVCRKYAPVVEKFSIDECFLDMSGTQRLYPNPSAIAMRMKNEIRDTLGFTVNIGIGPNKILAKMASDFEKPDQIHTLFFSEIPQKLWPLPVRALFTVGRATAQRLEKGGIFTIGDLAHANIAFVQTLIGKKLGQQLHEYANGIDSSPVLSQPGEAKGYQQFNYACPGCSICGRGKPDPAGVVGQRRRRMRADGVRAYCVCVTIRANDFKDKSHQQTLLEPTDITDEIFHASKSLFSQLWDGRTPLRLLGISLTELTRDEYAQQSLFTDEKKEKEKKLDRAVDSIRGKFGFDTISRGAILRANFQVGKKYRAQMDKDRNEDP